jgi:hypothetical protein
MASSGHPILFPLEGPLIPREHASSFHCKIDEVSLGEKQSVVRN